MKPDIKPRIDRLLFFVNILEFSPKEIFTFFKIMGVRRIDLTREIMADEMPALFDLHPGLSRFFQNMSEGKIDLDYLSDLFVSVQEFDILKIRFIESDNKWRPIKKIITGQALCYADLLIDDIFYIFDNGLAGVFQLLKKCELCGDFFIPQTNRGKFCRESHRVRYFQKKQSS